VGRIARGFVGFAEGGWHALELAAQSPKFVDRLVLVSTPVLEGKDVDAVAAKTLLLYGSKDPAGGHAQANWWRSRLGARIEMVPGGGHDILEHVWPRVLSFLAPRSLRK
jgi:pimeloyl-ACP methyl ester carboxylesterase